MFSCCESTCQCCCDCCDYFTAIFLYSTHDIWFKDFEKTMNKSTKKDKMNFGPLFENRMKR